MFLCRHCRCLFWKSFGHPCLYTSSSSEETGDGNKENNEPRPDAFRLVAAQNAAQAIPIAPPGPAQPWQAEFAQRNRLLQLQQQRLQQEEEEERLDLRLVPDSVPISPEAFLKFFSL